MYKADHFAAVRQEIKQYDAFREKLIKKSRDVLKLSKLIIYSVHRGEIPEAAKLIRTIEIERKKLDHIAKHAAGLIFEGSYKVAVQEYVEAILYFSIVTNKKLLTARTLKVKGSYYLLGLCDVPGELVRKAVFLAGKGRTSEVTEIKDLVDYIYGELLRFDIRDNETRRKIDAVKYDLKKLEDLVLQLKK
tara:strand:- start:1961 stop:2530 length:570 start_codon:yes stop_codon:yes gene_type:complete